MQVIALLVLGIVLIGAFGAAWESRFMRPYIGMFGIALVVAIAGLVVGLVAPEATAGVESVALWIAALTGLALCLHLVVRIFAAIASKA